MNYQQLVLVREFDDRMGWAKWSYPNCAEWLSWRCGISLSTAREKVRTAQALRDLPAISLAFREGRLSYTKVRALTRVAAQHGEDSLLRYALGATAPDVEERCRQIRNVHPDSVHDARRAWEARWLSVSRNAARGTLCMRVELPMEVGELVLKAIERAMEQDEVAEAVAETSKSSFFSQQADALVAVSRAYLDGGAAAYAADSVSTADRYQVVVHVDEAALHGGAGRADAPLETVKRLACDASLGIVTEDERGTPLNVLHEGGYRIRRDYQGDHYFVRADGRVIPRCGYRADDCTDDYALEDPSVEGSRHAGPEPANPSMEVREPHGVYYLSRGEQAARAAG